MEVALFHPTQFQDYRRRSIGVAAVYLIAITAMIVDSGDPDRVLVWKPFISRYSQFIASFRSLATQLLEPVLEKYASRFHHQHYALLFASSSATWPGALWFR
jgi:hypothetical protein